MRSTLGRRPLFERECFAWVSEKGEGQEIRSGKELDVLSEGISVQLGVKKPLIQHPHS
jgi:hypothetical protein